MTLLFINDIAHQSHGGGSFVVGWHVHRQMERYFGEVTYRHIPPQPPLAGSFISKLRRRVFGMPGGFSFFSEQALRANALRVERALSEVPADAVFFRSAAPWCGWRADRPYFVSLDVVFHTFFHNTFQPDDFIRSDLERIWRMEADFLEGAAAVFFESRWGMDRAIEAYGLKGGHYHALGRGGVIGPPDADLWDGTSLKLVTMAMKFRQKGGDLVLEAYRMLKPRFPGLSWHVIGGPPEGDWQSLSGIHYEGVIHPDEDAGAKRMSALLAQAFVLVHPTREDTNPLVITEAAYFGCPSISVDRFAIPELVLDGRTGTLIKAPVTAEALAASIEELILDRTRYVEMRRQARAHALENYQWDRIGEAIAEVIGIERRFSTPVNR